MLPFSTPVPFSKPKSAFAFGGDNVTRSNIMSFWEWLFGSRSKAPSATTPPAAHRGPIEDVPQGQSDSEILQSVLKNIYMRILSRARGAPPDNPNIGPRCQQELQVIQHFRNERGYSY